MTLNKSILSILRKVFQPSILIYTKSFPLLWKSCPLPPPNGSYMCFVGVFLISWIWFLVENFGKKERMKKVALWCSKFSFPPPRSSKSERVCGWGGRDGGAIIQIYTPVFLLSYVFSHYYLNIFPGQGEK